MQAMTAQVNTAGVQSFNSSAVVTTKQITSYSAFASSSINVVRDTPTGTYGFVRITAGTPSYITLSQSGAVSFWIRVNPDSTLDNLLLWDISQNIFMNIPNSTSASNANQVVVSDKSITLNSGTVVTDGNWHNITWSSPSGGPEKLYIDGNLVDQEDISGSRGTRNFIYVGYNGYQDTATGGLSFQGDMDDFMMFQQDLAESEVKQIYAMGAPSHPVAKANTAK
jgi:hypothetical protein